MLELTVFFSGALVMVLEMVGGRVLAPHVGTSAIVWTSLIGVVLVFLALGAWAGGRYADSHLSRRGLAKALLGAGIGAALSAFLHHGIGAFVSASLGNLYLAAVGAALGIFALPAFFFGMITPYVIRLRIASVDTAGATVGRLYALSTFGSILGTFLGGFVLISFFASTAILWAVAVSMLLLSLANEPARPWARILLLALFLFLAWQDRDYAAWRSVSSAERILESPYNSLRIYDAKDQRRQNAPVRLMATDPGYSQSGMFLADPAEPYFAYTRFYALGPWLRPMARSALMLGGGGYSVPKWLLSGKSALASPKDLRLTVVELDPLMTESARRYFGLKDDARLKIIHEDARTFLNRQQESYDLVFVDLFNSHYSVPFHLATREAVRRLRQAVAPGGVLLMNLISAVDGEDGRLLQAVYQAMSENFAELRIYLVGEPYSPGQVQNLMLLAFADKTDDNMPVVHAPRSMSPGPAEIEAMERTRYLKTPAFSVTAMSDDFAPVERYTLMLTRN